MINYGPYVHREPQKYFVIYYIRFKRDTVTREVGWERDIGNIKKTRQCHATGQKRNTLSAPTVLYRPPSPHTESTCSLNRLDLLHVRGALEKVQTRVDKMAKPPNARYKNSPGPFKIFSGTANSTSNLGCMRRDCFSFHSRRTRGMISSGRAGGKLKFCRDCKVPCCELVSHVHTAPLFEGFRAHVVPNFYCALSSLFECMSVECPPITAIIMSQI